MFIITIIDLVFSYAEKISRMLEKEQQDSEADKDITDNSEYEDDGLFDIPESECDQEEEGFSDKDDICVGDDMPNDGLSQEDVTGIENDPRFEKTVDLSDFDIQWKKNIPPQ